MADEAGRIEFTKEMRKTYKLLFPNMAEIHFRILQNTFRSYGYNVELLTNDGQEVVDEGLKYVHNDICYPALLTIGQMISALKSGKYDLNHVALMMTQTGGGCRASNYIFLLRKALKNAGMGQVPVVSVNLSGLEKNSGFKITLPLLRRALAALTYGDLLMRRMLAGVIYGDMIMLLSNQTRPYEKNPGETDALVDKWVDDICARFLKGKGFQKKQIRTLTREIVASFDRIEILPVKKIRVGIVGEIYAKYSPLANNHLEDFLRSQDCEVNVPGIMAFMLFKVDNRLEDIKLYGGNPLKKFVIQILYDYLDESKLFHNPVRHCDRSLMNVTFVTGDADKDAAFVKAATAAGFVNLKGHRSVGGMRASIYNAMPPEGIDKLVDFMEKFRKENA